MAKNTDKEMSAAPVTITDMTDAEARSLLQKYRRDFVWVMSSMYGERTEEKAIAAIDRAIAALSK